MKVAVVHDWLTVYGGAERVLELIFQIYPDADLYTVVDFFPDQFRDKIANKRAKTTFIQKLPFSKKLYRYYLPWMPFAIEQFDLTQYDLVISSSTSVAKGVITGPHQLHVCYCNSPMRYIWDLQFQYLEEAGYTKGLKEKFFGYYIRKKLFDLRLWDYRSAQSVDHFIANSQFVSKRIQKYYRRNSIVIYPPVDTNFFSYIESKEDFYLTSSRLVPYKKIDLIAEAFGHMPDKKLVIIGEGPEEKKIKKLLKSNIHYLGYQPPHVLKSHLQKAKGYVFAGVEDFGIAPLEAQSCGTPVIAFNKGGVSETIQGLNQSNPTGVFFEKQTTQCIINVIHNFEKNYDLIDPLACRNNALQFSIERFKEEFKTYIDEITQKENDESTHISRWKRDSIMANVTV